MKSNAPTLFPNEKVATKVIEYAASKSDELPANLLKYHEFILGLERSNLTISTFQAQSLSFLAQLAGAKRVLEIGVFRGFSSLVWAHAVGPDGQVTGLELSEEYAGYARKAFENQGVKNAEVIVGNALQTLNALDPDEPYDLIFIDAQKSGYPAYLKAIIEKSAPDSARRLLKKGGLIVADNVLRRGLVADMSHDNPAAAKERELIAASGYGTNNDLEALDEFNTALRKDTRFDAFLLPLFDGVSLARLLV